MKEESEVVTLLLETPCCLNAITVEKPLPNFFQRAMVVGVYIRWRRVLLKVLRQVDKDEV